MSSKHPAKTSFAPVRVSQLEKDVSMLKIPPLDLSMPAKSPLEIFGEPQGGKTLYGIYLAKKIAEQRGGGDILVMRCEKFDSNTIPTACNLFGIDPDIIDLMPPRSPEVLLDAFGADYMYEINDKTGRLEVAILDNEFVNKIERSPLSKYKVIFIDTFTSILNVITSAGMKNFPARNIYENIVMTFIDILTHNVGVSIITTHEHSKDVTQPYSSVEMKGGKEMERRCDYILRMSPILSANKRAFRVYAKRWALIYPENTLLGSIKLVGNDFVRSDEDAK